MLIREFKGLKNTKIRFICDNNMDFMKQMQEDEKWKYYHFAIVDPPYGIDITNRMLGKSMEQIKQINKTRERGDWDSKPPEKDYFDLLFWISRNQIIWGANYMLEQIGKSCEKFYLWDKEQSDKLSFADCEFAWTSFKGAPKMIKRSRMKDIKDEKIHDTQKPIYLYDYLFCDMKKKHELKEGQRILDTHGGSHTIAIAAYKHAISLDVIEMREAAHLSGIDKFLQSTQQSRLEF